MIQALRKKFILINMLLVFLVLAAVFSALTISSSQKAKEESQMTLHMALNRRENIHPPMFEVGKKPPADFVRAPVFVMNIDIDGKIQVVQNSEVSISAADVEAIGEAVLRSEKDSAVLQAYNLRFLRRQEGTILRVAFVELTTEQTAVRNALLMSAVALVGTLTAFFLISLFLSRWALRPVERAWEQQRRFVSDASHELKTPLTVILANMDILQNQRACTVDSQWKWLHNTREEARRMKDLVDSLLFLAKHDQARERVGLHPVNLSEIVTNIALAFESLAFEGNVSLKAEEIEENLFVLGDENQLKQLVSILIDNGIKYAKAQGEVCVRLCQSGAKVAFHVYNEGTPLAKEELSHLFERFYRADESRSQEGYGLGLAIAKTIAEAHQGKLLAESLAEGNLFAASFPSIETLVKSRSS